MVWGIEGTGEHSSDRSLPAFVSGSVCEDTVDWLMPVQWVVYWFDGTLKGYSHRVHRNPFLALCQESRWWKQFPYWFQGSAFQHFSPSHADYVKQRQENDSIQSLEYNTLYIRKQPAVHVVLSQHGHATSGHFELYSNVHISLIKYWVIHNR